MQVRKSKGPKMGSQETLYATILSFNQCSSMHTVCLLLLKCPEEQDGLFTKTIILKFCKRIFEMYLAKSLAWVVQEMLFVTIDKIYLTVYLHYTFYTGAYDQTNHVKLTQTDFIKLIFG